MLKKYKNISPKLDQTTFVEDTAIVIGDVEIGVQSSVWFYSVIRGDVNSIKIGDYSNIQDGSILHVTNKKHCGDNPKKGELIIGNYVTVGHSVTLHACKISDYALIGMGAVILDDAQIGECSVVAAGSVVKEGFIVPPYTLVAGNPAVIKKEFPKTKEIKEQFYKSAQNYFDLIEDYKNE
jgi:carbonic anhydrase/acetyltransferase-like protein (isoleucine patch superfamily)